MHSDYWAGVPYEQCPPHIQSNIRVIGRMDAFRSAARKNLAALERYVESLFQGVPIPKPKPVRVPSVDDAEMEYFMRDSIRDADDVVSLMRGDDSKIIAYFTAVWCDSLARKSDYLEYNRKALQKRIRKGSDQAELDRVGKLISDGEAEVAFLVPRIQWAKSKNG